MTRARDERTVGRMMSRPSWKDEKSVAALALSSSSTPCGWGAKGLTRRCPSEKALERCLRSTALGSRARCDAALGTTNIIDNGRLRPDAWREELAERLDGAAVDGGGVRCGVEGLPPDHGSRASLDA